MMNARMHISKLILAFTLIACATVSLAQNTSPAMPLPHPIETTTVLGSATPVPLTESPSAVVVLAVAPQLLSLGSPQDLLREDASVQLKSRGAGGGQADIVLRGGSFEQALVLLNGFRINDSQSAHHNLDLPLPLEAMDSIQVLHGAGSTLHGVDALSGVVDFLTAAPTTTSLRLRAGGGSFGSMEDSLLGSLVHKQQSLRLTASRNSSDGFAADRDYQNKDASLEGWSGSRLGLSDLFFAASDRAFGANQFYGAYDSWERTKGLFASGRQELGTRTMAAFGYRRHTDEFILLREAPSVYENNHTDGSWQASLRHTVPVASGSVLLLGVEASGDSIRSYNRYNGALSYALGIHARNQGAGYADLDLRPAKSCWNFSLGFREELFSGGNTAFAPHLAGSVRLPHQFKLRASGGYGFRLPTYTDLYYVDPATLGNARLKPESAWSGEGGADWAPSGRLSLSVTGFYTRQHETIDYVRAASLPNALLPTGCPVNKWCATNLNGLHFAGMESSATWIPAKGQAVRVGWTSLIGGQAPLNGLQSEYALNYPVENIHASWTVALGHALSVSNSVAITKPNQQAGIAPWNGAAYPVWNAALSHDAGRIRPYLRLANLSNTGYQEINGVAMPSRSIIGGVSLALGR